MEKEECVDHVPMGSKRVDAKTVVEVLFANMGSKGERAKNV